MRAKPGSLATARRHSRSGYGRGTRFYANGDRYEGEWREGKKHGRGTFFYANGDRYEGEWRDLPEFNIWR